MATNATSDEELRQLLASAHAQRDQLDVDIREMTAEQKWRAKTRRERYDRAQMDEFVAAIVAAPDGFLAAPPPEAFYTMAFGYGVTSITFTFDISTDGRTELTARGPICNITAFKTPITPIARSLFDRVKARVPLPLTLDVSSTYTWPGDGELRVTVRDPPLPTFHCDKFGNTYLSVYCLDPSAPPPR